MIGALVDRIAVALLAIAAVLVPLVMLAIVAGVVGAMVGINPLVTFPATVPLLGDRLSLQGLGDLQWHLYAVMMMLVGGAAVWTGGHVRVDVILERLPRRLRTGVDVIGHLLFAVPATWLLTGPAWAFAHRAFTRGEASPDGGLIDRWMVKGALWLGLALLLAFVLADLARKVGDLFRKTSRTP